MAAGKPRGHLITFCAQQHGVVVHGVFLPHDAFCDNDVFWGAGVGRLPRCSKTQLSVQLLILLKLS